jgi:hypothetical protein
VVVELAVVLKVVVLNEAVRCCPCSTCFNQKNAAVSDLALRDGIVDPFVHSNCTNEIMQFIAWVPGDQAGCGKVNFDALDLERKNEGKTRMISELGCELRRAKIELN